MTYKSNFKCFTLNNLIDVFTIIKPPLLMWMFVIKTY